MMDLPAVSKPVAAAIVLAILWMLEGLLPMFEGSGQRGRPDISNIALGVGNSLVASVLFAAATLSITEWVQGRGFGLLNLTSFPAAVRLPLAVVVFDFWQYFWQYFW